MRDRRRGHDRGGWSSDAPRKIALGYLPAPACTLAARAPHRQAIAATKQGASRPIAAAGSSSGAAPQPLHELEHPFILDAIRCNELV